MHALKLVVGDDQGRKSGEVCKDVRRKNGNFVVAQIEPRQRLEVLESVALDGGDLVDVEVELGGLGRDALGDLGQLGMAAPDDGASAAAGGRAIVGTKATNVVAVCNKQD